MNQVKQMSNCYESGLQGISVVAAFCAVEPKCSLPGPRLPALPSGFHSVQTPEPSQFWLNCSMSSNRFVILLAKENPIDLRF